MQVAEISPLLKKAQAALEDSKEWAGTPAEEASIASKASEEALKLLQNEDPENEITEEYKSKIISNAAERAIRQFRAQRREKAYWEKVFSPIEYKKMAAWELYRYVLKVKAPEIYGTDENGRSKLVIDKWNRHILKQFCFYFSDDKRFNGDLKKGNIVYGPVGCGKTTLFELFCVNAKQSFRVRHCMEIAEQYQKYGVEELEKFYTALPIGIPEQYYGQKVLGYCFDDFGTELEKGNYGNKINVMRDITLTRYQNKRSIPFTLTHISTNLTSDQIKEKYGITSVDMERLGRRFREMFNIIAFDENAPDRSL